jgi:hypothetical protein
MLLDEPLIDVVKDPVSRALMSDLFVRCLPLAMMGVRLRVRHQSCRRAQGTHFFPVLPELFLITVFPVTPGSAFRRISRARARRLPSRLARHAATSVAAAIQPFAW